MRQTCYCASNHRTWLQDAAFFDHNNPVGLAERERAFQLALADMMGYLRSDAGQVAIFDATNSTQERREKLVGEQALGMLLQSTAWGGCAFGSTS